MCITLFCSFLSLRKHPFPRAFAAGTFRAKRPQRRRAWRNGCFHRLFISLPFLHDYDVKMPNIAIYGERSTPGEFANIWQRRWVGMIAMKTRLKDKESDKKPYVVRGKFTQRWLVELDLIFRRASQSPPWNGLRTLPFSIPSAPLTKRGLPSLLVPPTSFRGGRGETSGVVAKYPVGMKWGIYRHRQPLLARGQALQLWKNARVSLSSAYRARLWRVTARDSPNLLLYTDSDPVILC